MTELPTSPPASPAARPSIQLTTDAVVASYIHEISDRHRPVDEVGDESPSGDQSPRSSR